MMFKPLPTIDILKHVVSYDNETGSFSLTTTAGLKDSIKISTRGVSVIISTEKYLGHRIAWKLCNGVDPRGLIDHIDGDTLNNRINNLRDVTPMENSQNRSRSVSNTTGCTGVHRYKNGFSSTINVDGKQVLIGIYGDFKAAVMARKEAETKYGYHKNHDREVRAINLQLHPDGKIIDALGGTCAVAKICQVTPQAVTQWKVHGIPKSRTILLQVVHPEIFDTNSVIIAKESEPPPNSAHIESEKTTISKRQPTERLGHAPMTKNELISELGSPAELARAAGVSPQAVSQWAGEAVIPLHSAIKVAKHTGRKLHELRPDLFADDEEVRAGVEPATGGAA